MLACILLFLRLSSFLIVINVVFFPCSYANDITTLKAILQSKQTSFTNVDKLNQLGMDYYKKGRYKQALPLWQLVLSIRKKQLGAAHPSTATSLNNLAALYRAMGRYSQAESLYQRALAIREKQLGVEHLSTAASLNNLAGLYQAMGMYNKVEPLYQRALAIYKKQLGDEHSSIVISLNNLAEFYRAMGKYSQAEPLYQHALTILKKQPEAENALMATILNNLAMLYQTIGSYSQAEKLYQRILTIKKKKLGVTHPAMATSLNNLALLCKTMGAYSQAESLFQYVLMITEKQLGADHPSTAISLNNLAGFYNIVGMDKQAEPLYRRALGIHEKKLGAEHPSTAISLSNLAGFYKGIGLYNQAKPLYQRALAIHEKQLGADHLLTATSLNNLAVLHQDMGNYSQANQLYQRALVSIEKQLGAEHLNTATSLSNYARLLKKQNNPKSAIFIIKHVINILQLSRQKNIKLPKELKSSFIGKNENSYRELVKQLLNQNRLQEAEHVMAMYKEKEVADYYKKDKSIKDNRPPTLIDFTAEEKLWNERYKKITSVLYSNYQAYKKLNEKDVKDRSQQEQQQITQLKKTLATNTKDFKQFLNDIRQPWPKNTIKSSPKSHDALQKNLAQLGEGVVMLSYFVQKDKLRILLTTPTTRILRETDITAKDLGELVKTYRSKLQQKSAIRGLSQTLHKYLIDPIVTDLKQANAKILMLSLDQTLRYLPMSALHNGESYLIERYKLSLYSPAVGYQALTAETSKQPQVMAMGVTEAVTIQPSSLLSGQEPFNFNALPYVRNEVEGIVRSKDSTGFLAGKIYLDKDAKKPVLIDALSKMPVEIIHLATHFQLNQGNGYQSFLLLGQQTTLPIAELYRHPEVHFKAVDLLTVSACNTGMIGEQSDGSEVESFAAIAQQKGAKAVLASLWAVEDRSTSILMQNFYRVWQQGERTSKIVALQKAQQHFIQQGKHVQKPDCPALRVPEMALCADLVAYPQQSHPYFWAPFTLIGNWR